MVIRTSRRWGFAHDAYSCPPTQWFPLHAGHHDRMATLTCAECEDVPCGGGKAFWRDSLHYQLAAYETEECCDSEYTTIRLPLAHRNGIPCTLLERRNRRECVCVAWLL